MRPSNNSMLKDPDCLHFNFVCYTSIHSNILVFAKVPAGFKKADFFNL